MPRVRVTANGKPYDLSEETTLDAFVRDRGLDPRFVIVERNGEPVERSRFGDVELGDGDRLELVRAVAGG